MGDGRWVNVGGYKPVQSGSKGTSGPYYDQDGGFAVRFLTPCDDEGCNWVDNKSNYLTTRRWYPTM